MAKKRLKLTPAGILFLIAIAVLVVALIAVIVVLSTTCGGEREASRANTVATASPSADPTDLPGMDLATDDPNTDLPNPSDDPGSNEPNEPTTTDDISGLAPIETPDPNSAVVVTTPNAIETNTPAATAKIYTSPTTAQKKAAKDGYVYKDGVRMRKGPGTSYDVVKSDISKNTAVTLYELQDGWWFLKCGSSYGYIKKDFIKEGKLDTSSNDSSGTATYEGTIKTNSTAALRSSADTKAKCIKTYENGKKITVYYKTKGADGKMWYYVTVDKNKGYIRSDLVSTSSKVPTK